MNLSDKISKFRKKYIADKNIKYFGYFFDASLIITGLVTSILFPPAAMAWAGVALTAVSYNNYNSQAEMQQGGNEKEAIAIGYQHIMLVSTIFLTLIILGPALGPVAPFIPIIWAASTALVVISALCSGGYSKLQYDWGITSENKVLQGIIKTTDRLIYAFTYLVDSPYYMFSSLLKMISSESVERFNNYISYLHKKIQTLKADKIKLESYKIQDRIKYIYYKSSTIAYGFLKFFLEGITTPTSDLLYYSFRKLHAHAGNIFFFAQQLLFIGVSFIVPPLGIAGLLYAGVNKLREEKYLNSTVASKVEDFNNYMEFVSGVFIPNGLMQIYTFYKGAALILLKVLMPKFTKKLLGEKSVLINNESPNKTRSKIQKNIKWEDFEKLVETMPQVKLNDSEINGIDADIDVMLSELDSYKSEKLEDLTQLSENHKRLKDSPLIFNRLKYYLQYIPVKAYMAINKIYRIPSIYVNFFEQQQAKNEYSLNIEHILPTDETLPEPEPLSINEIQFVLDKLDFKSQRRDNTCMASFSNSPKFRDINRALKEKLEASIAALQKKVDAKANKSIELSEEDKKAILTTEQEYDLKHEIFKDWKILYGHDPEAVSDEDIAIKYVKEKFMETCDKVLTGKGLLKNKSTKDINTLRKKATFLLQDYIERFSDGKEEEFFEFVLQLSIDAGEYCATAADDIIVEKFNDRILPNFIATGKIGNEQKILITELLALLKSLRKEKYDFIYNALVQNKLIKSLFFHMDLQSGRHDIDYVNSFIEFLNIHPNDSGHDLSNKSLDLLKEVSASIIAIIITQILTSTKNGYTANNILIDLAHEINNPQIRRERGSKLTGPGPLLQRWLNTFEDKEVRECTGHTFYNDNDIEKVLALFLYDSEIIIPNDPSIKAILDGIIDKNKKTLENKNTPKKSWLNSIRNVFCPFYVYATGKSGTSTSKISPLSSKLAAGNPHRKSYQIS